MSVKVNIPMVDLMPRGEQQLHIQAPFHFFGWNFISF
jgi:hypothetical protein